MNKKKVLIGMSGGVDSSVAALLLLQQGYDVTGVTMKLRPNDQVSKCCSINDIDDARRVCYKIGIDHIVLNFTELFSEKVIKYFIEEYKSGRTPNPCIACNNYLKFDALLNKAKLLNFDYIATGHYAKIKFDQKLKRYLLYRACCSKDQSYVLYNMDQDQLAHTLFPLNDLEKSEIRKIAQKNNLPVANKPDSQEICFIPNNDYSSFIKRQTNSSFEKGNFIDKDKNILGQHKGIINYTIGQRKGLGITFGKPMYVSKINSNTNEITLVANKDLFSKELIADNLNFITFDSFPKESLKLQAKIRYQAKPADVLIIPIEDNKIKVIFDTPQRAITPGQAIVFYDKDLVIGGGIIKHL